MIEFDCKTTRDQFAFDAAFHSDARLTGLIGPSGSGKSTIIQLIAGLIRPERGRICVNGKTLVDTAQRIWIPPHKRAMGLVFQDAQLFPHLTVHQNLTYGRFFVTAPNPRITLSSIVGVLGIEHLLNRSPLTLSGGERQRVAIGRALYASPAMLLMDEPLSSLDTNRKLEILPYIERLRDEFSVPILYVSHSVEEVARLASQVVKVGNGTVLAAGPADAVLSPPDLAQSAGRFDAVSTISASFERYDATYGISDLRHPSGKIVVPGEVAPGGKSVRIVIRATNVSLSIGRPERISIRSILTGRIERIENTGPYARVVIELTGGDRIVAYVTRLSIADLGLTAGSEIYALIKSVAIDELGISGLRQTS